MKRLLVLALVFVQLAVLCFCISPQCDGKTTEPTELSAQAEAAWYELCQGKKISILGDSISTFRGWSESTLVNTTLGNNLAFYGSPTLLPSVEDTWWKQAIDRCGMELLVTNSWSGATVSGANDKLGKESFGWNTRCQNLHDNTLENNPAGRAIAPDIIAIYMGTNDLLLWASCPNSFDSAFWQAIELEGYEPSDARNFQESYALMVYKVRSAYPDADIFLFTLPKMRLGDAKLLNAYNHAIVTTAERYDCFVVELSGTELDDYTTYTIDGIHPNALGMDIMTDAFADALACRYVPSDAPQPKPEPPLSGLRRAEDGEYYYYVNGSIQSDFTGLVENNLGSWYIKNGHAQLSYDGVIEHAATKYLIKAGHVNTAYTGLIRVDGGRWMYFAEGRQDTEYVGMVTRAGMQGYVENGEVNFNKSGVVSDNGTLKYVKYGIFRNTFKGLARADDGNWLYFVNGTLDSTYTGVAKLNTNWVYVENGYVNFNYSGTITVGNYDYTVKYGVVQF